MPQMADIVIKAADGTTNVTYVAKAPSSGDNTAAVWRNDAASDVGIGKPQFSLKTRFNGNKTARRFEAEYVFPIVALNSTTNVKSVVSKIPISISGVLPLNATDAQIKEAVYQYSNLLVAQLIRDSLVSGYSAS